MKKILFLWMILLGFSTISTRSAETQVKAASLYYEDRYQFQGGYYPSLGFGSQETHFAFMTNQVTKILVYFFPQTGSGGNTVPGVGFYDFDITTEDLNDAIERVTNTEFNRVLAVTKWKADQQFFIITKLYNLNGGVQFVTDRLSFHASVVGSSFHIPDSVTREAKLMPWGTTGAKATGIHTIAWPGISRASLLVRDSQGKLLYYGDSINNNYEDTNFFVLKTDSLVINHKWLTNGYSIVLNVYIVNDKTYEEMSVSYNGDGDWVYPYGIQPLVSMDPKKPGSLSIIGGAPGSSLGIKCYSEIGGIPEVMMITLDMVGSTTWTYPTNKPMQFFVVDPFAEVSPAKK